ncbi:MAG: ATPase, T2SS/T4P/T4SS family [Candidatus Omnitrophota bacterium]
MKSRTLAIFSNKGGVGKTFVAVNLAVTLARENNEVILVDLDSQAGQDMARMLNVTPKVAMVDILSSLTASEKPQDIKKHVVSHSSGIDFISGTTHLKQAPYLTAERLKIFIEKVSQIYDYVIIDVGKAFTENLVTVFDLSNLILLIVTPDILAVYQTRWSLDVLQTLRFPLKMVKLILNRSESKGGVAWQEVRSALPCEIFARIPSEGKPVGMALNRGNPVVIDSPRSKVAVSFRKLVQDLDKSNLYVEHQEIAKLRTIDKLPKPGEFWQKFGILEPIKSMKLFKDKEEDELVKIKRKIHSRVLEKMDLRRLDLATINDPKKMGKLRQATEQIISNLLGEETGAVIDTYKERDRLVKEIADEVLGLGPLEDLLRDEDITDIMVNNKDEIYVERLGKLELTQKTFISDVQVKAVIDRIIAPLGRKIDESTPTVDARLPDGSRINAVIPPLSLGGPMLTIRKFGRERYIMDDLINRFNSIIPTMAQFLEACVLARKNMIVSGGTGSGKTTLLNILSLYIPKTERIITIEDAAELKLQQPHWARLESRPPNIEGKGEVTIRDLFKNTLRMRPDRIIIGECRGPEVLDMLQAMNTGHDGSLSTVHANSTQDVLARFDSMILMSGIELPFRAIREMIASAIHLIVHTTRLSDGSRKVVQISEIVGMLDETHINLKDIFVFRQKGIDKDGKVLGEFRPTGYVPTFFDEMLTRGIVLPDDIFKK